MTLVVHMDNCLALLYVVGFFNSYLSNSSLCSKQVANSEHLVIVSGTMFLSVPCLFLTRVLTGGVDTFLAMRWPYS